MGNGIAEKEEGAGVRRGERKDRRRFERVKRDYGLVKTGFWEGDKEK